MGGRRQGSPAQPMALRENYRLGPSQAQFLLQPRKFRVTEHQHLLQTEPCSISTHGPRCSEAHKQARHRQTGTNLCLSPEGRQGPPDGVVAPYISMTYPGSYHPKGPRYFTLTPASPAHPGILPPLSSCAGS